MYDPKSTPASNPVLPDDTRLPWLDVDRLPLAYIVCDADLRVVAWNRAAETIFGYKREEVLGKVTVEMITPVPIKTEILDLIDRIRAGDMNAHSVAEHCTKDGQRIYCEWFNTPLHDPNGKFTHMVCLARDVTARKQTEDELQHYAARLQGLSRRLVEVQETERRHLARELHDQFGQILTGLLMLLTSNDTPMPEPAKARCLQAQNLTRDLLDRVRKLSFDLRPAALDQLGLAPALLSLFARFTELTMVRVDFRHQELDTRFPSEVETAAFRIVQEALTNVARHAQVDEATVRVWATPEVLGVRIEDSGRGFDSSVNLASVESSGLTGMHERARLLGCQLTVESRPGHGTVITAELPIRPANEPAE